MRFSNRAAIVAIVLVSFAVTLAELPRSDWPTLEAMSLASGVVALAMMAASALLGGRFKLIETLFGGLDRVYLAHKWLAVWALAFASFHFAFKAGMQTWDTASIVTLPPFYTRLVRQLSLLALGLILLLALNRRIPYHRWRWWHKLSGPLFLIVVLHWLSFKSPIELASPAGAWLAVLSALGIAAAAYKLLLYRFVSSHAEYRVAKAVRDGSGLHLQLEPLDKPISFKAGQFGFVSLKEDGLREPHPFTIASANDGHMHFVIRDLGDYTHRLLKMTKEGMHADAYAPFGRFERSASGRREIWIAGGVGISPFIAWLTDESAMRTPAATLFYFFTPGREFPTAERIRQLAVPSATQVVPVSGGPSDAAFMQRFEQIVNEAGTTSVEVSFCGPKGLLEQVRATMTRLGVPDANLRFEYFEFR
jgi:predicted ferric reductase